MSEPTSVTSNQRCKHDYFRECPHCEIERLRNDLQELTCGDERYTRLGQDNQRLRAALTQIAAWHGAKPRAQMDDALAAILAKALSGDSSAPETKTPLCIDCLELKNALAAAVRIANEARECHDRDQDMRVMKILIALSGHLPKWRADTDRIHDVLRRAVERLDSAQETGKDCSRCGKSPESKRRNGCHNIDCSFEVKASPESGPIVMREHFCSHCKHNYGQHKPDCPFNSAQERVR